MTATHIEDAVMVALNGPVCEATVMNLINNDPNEGGAIPGTFRMASVRDNTGYWYLACLMDCACKERDGLF